MLYGFSMTIIHWMTLRLPLRPFDKLRTQGTLTCACGTGAGRANGTGPLVLSVAAPAAESKHAAMERHQKVSVLRLLQSGLWTWLVLPTLAYAQVVVPVTQVRHSGVSALWILANICYAGMRAQANPSHGWRIASFIFGFPGTLVSYFVIQEGSDRAYGIDLPRKH